MTALEPEYTEPWVKPVGVITILGLVWWLLYQTAIAYIDSQYDHCPPTNEYTTIANCKREGDRL